MCISQIFQKEHVCSTYTHVSDFVLINNPSHPGRVMTRYKGELIKVFGSKCSECSKIAHVWGIKFHPYDFDSEFELTSQDSAPWLPIDDFTKILTRNIKSDLD